MDDIVVVEVIDGIEDLANRFGSVLFSEFSLLADSVEQLSASRQLGHNVVLVLRGSASRRLAAEKGAPTRDSNQSWNLTMCGCFMRCSISSSS